MTNLIDQAKQLRASSGLRRLIDNTRPTRPNPCPYASQTGSYGQANGQVGESPVIRQPANDPYGASGEPM